MKIDTPERKTKKSQKIPPFKRRLINTKLN